MMNVYTSGYHFHCSVRVLGKEEYAYTVGLDSPHISVYVLRALEDPVSAATARAIPMLDIAHYTSFHLQPAAVQYR